MTNTEQPPVPPAEPRGVATSEFWLTVCTMLVGLALVLFGPEGEARTAGIAMLAGAPALYGIGRGMAKRGAS